MPFRISSASWNGCTFVWRTYTKKVGKRVYTATTDIPCKWAESVVSINPCSVIVCKSSRSGTTFRRKDGDLLIMDGSFGDESTSCGYSLGGYATWDMYRCELPSNESLPDDPLNWEEMEERGWSMDDKQCYREWYCDEIDA